MNRLARIAALIVPGLMVSASSLSQGSGDAGLLSSGNVFILQNPSFSQTSLGVNGLFSIGGQQTLHYSAVTSAEINIWQGITLRATVPYHYISGELANTSGLGDLRIYFLHSIVDNGKILINLSLGAAVPSGDANRGLDGKPLPMEYQTSAGTYSILTDIAFRFHDWKLAVGYQHSFQQNENEFLYSAWGDDPLITDYPESNGLSRGDDILLNLEKAFIRDKASYYLSLLPVYHLDEDEIMKDDVTVHVDGSDGLILNMAAASSFSLGKGFYFDLVACAPVVQREVQPDGLKRIFVASAGIRYVFDDIYNPRP